MKGSKPKSMTSAKLNKMYRLLLLFSIIIISGEISAQCDTPPRDVEGLIDNGDLLNPLPVHRNQTSPPYIIRVYTHILRNFDGTNAATTISALEGHLDNMADQFAEHDICFVWVGNDFIDNTNWNTNYNTSMINFLHAVNPHDDAIDIYIHADGWSNSGGNSYSIPSRKISVAMPWTFNFTHEMGHALGLLHTFETAFGFECPTGENCDFGGDFVCDTPADYPGLHNDIDSFPSCQYIGNATLNCEFLGIGTGTSVPYEPDFFNHMSYGGWCTQYFTPGQGARMRSTIAGSSGLQECLVEQTEVVTNITPTSEFYRVAVDQIDVGNFGSGDVSIWSAVKSTFTAGGDITFKPGTTLNAQVLNAEITAEIKDISCN